MRKIKHVVLDKPMSLIQVREIDDISDMSWNQFVIFKTKDNEVIVSSVVNVMSGTCDCCYVEETVISYELWEVGDYFEI
jgi:NCAIR mutase (PurE)-related protein